MPNPAPMKNLVMVNTMKNEKKLDKDWWVNFSVVYQNLARWCESTSRIGRNVRRAWKSKKAIEDVWVEPLEYVKITSEIMLNRTGVYDMDFWLLTFGYEGSGKSSIELMQYVEILKKINGEAKKQIIRDLIFMQSEYAQTVYLFGENKILRHPIQIDDAHYVFGKYLGQTTETLSILQLARFIRDQQIIHLLNTQVPQQLFTDIWNERVNVYQYCFFIDRIDPKTDLIKSRDMYVAWYNERQTQILKDLKDVRRPLFWERILTKVKPFAITRFDVLFPIRKYNEVWQVYRWIKGFYKKFYSLTRYLGISKGKHFEVVFRILHDLSYVEPGTSEFEKVLSHHISAMPELTKRKLIETEVLVKDEELISSKNPEGLTLFPDLLNLAYRYKDVIQIRSGIRGQNIKKILQKAKEEAIQETIMENIARLHSQKGICRFSELKNLLKQSKISEKEIWKLHEKGVITIDEKQDVVFISETELMQYL